MNVMSENANDKNIALLLSTVQEGLENVGTDFAEYVNEMRTLEIDDEAIDRYAHILAYLTFSKQLLQEERKKKHNV